jgi:hypothetical protein
MKSTIRLLLVVIVVGCGPSQDDLDLIKELKTHVDDKVGFNDFLCQEKHKDDPLSCEETFFHDCMADIKTQVSDRKFDELARNVCKEMSRSKYPGGTR